MKKLLISVLLLASIVLLACGCDEITSSDSNSTEQVVEDEAKSELIQYCEHEDANYFMNSYNKYIDEEVLNKENVECGENGAGDYAVVTWNGISLLFTKGDGSDSYHITSDAEPSNENEDEYFYEADIVLDILFSDILSEDDRSEMLDDMRNGRAHIVEVEGRYNPENFSFKRDHDGHTYDMFIYEKTWNW
ncbi:MAG: hypothetical protein PUB75_01430 [Firmicutes bacterium]|nr:hypothetical protein [Bacillota bacterium]